MSLASQITALAQRVATEINGMKMPVAFAEKSAAQSFGSGAGTLMTFDQNFLREITYSAGAFTVPSAGWYRISARTGGYSGGGGSDRWLYVTRNTTSASSQYLNASTSVQGAHGLTSLSVVRKLDAGDVIRFYGLQNSGATYTLSDAQASIEMVARI